jgi:hypothetical protein
MAMKWCDRRDVRMLSTLHSDEIVKGLKMSPLNQAKPTVIMPQVIVEAERVVRDNCPIKLPTPFVHLLQR